LDRVTECGEQDCKCGIRCGNCQQNFVEKAEDLCQSCNDYLWCDSCGNEKATKHIYGKAAVTFVPMSVGKCSKCERKKGLNHLKVCEACLTNQNRLLNLCDKCADGKPRVCSKCEKTVDVLMKNGTCIPCSSEWEERESLRRAACGRCQKYALLDTTGICKQCSIEESIRQTDFVQCSNCEQYTTDDKVLCTSCESKFDKCLKCDTLVPKHSYFCVKHQPICVACGLNYQPHTFEDKFCGTCSESILKGQCPECENKTEHLSPRGLCIECEPAPTSKAYSCPRCGRPATSASQAGELCGTCKTSAHKCLKCGVVAVSPEKIVCTNCEMARKLR